MLKLWIVTDIFYLKMTLWIGYIETDKSKLQKINKKTKHILCLGFLFYFLYCFPSLLNHLKTPMDILN